MRWLVLRFWPGLFEFINYWFTLWWISVSLNRLFWDGLFWGQWVWVGFAPYAQGMGACWWFPTLNLGWSWCQFLVSCKSIRWNISCIQWRIGGYLFLNNMKLGENFFPILISSIPLEKIFQYMITVNFLTVVVLKFEEAQQTSVYFYEKELQNLSSEW